MVNPEIVCDRRRLSRRPCTQAALGGGGIHLVSPLITLFPGGEHRIWAVRWGICLFHSPVCPQLILSLMPNLQKRHPTEEEDPTEEKMGSSSFVSASGESWGGTHTSEAAFHYLEECLGLRQEEKQWKVYEALVYYYCFCLGGRSGGWLVSFLSIFVGGSHCVKALFGKYSRNLIIGGMGGRWGCKECLKIQVLLLFGYGEANRLGCDLSQRR